jgi:hypothetical protein
MYDRYDPRADDRRELDDGVRDREEQWLSVGRGPGSNATRDGQDEHGVKNQWNEREERDALTRERDDDPTGMDLRDVFMRDLDLPRGHEREIVHDRARDYRLNESDARTLATLGAFRIVSERDLHDTRDVACDGRDGDLRHLREEGLIERLPLDGRDRAIVLTERGRTLLEGHRRDRDGEHRQAFHAGAGNARERTHDVEIYRAYLKAAERLQGEEARILRVELDRELKREYQRFLQARNTSDRDNPGQPNRTPQEIEEWARSQQLPYFDEHVHFPDLRIEYEDRNGELRHLDLEVTTEHYRGAHGAAASRSGFAIHSAGGGRSGGRTFDPRAAEEFI